MACSLHKISLWRRWLIRGLALMLALLIADYVLYPHLSGIGGRSMDRGENGLWLRYEWYFGRKSDGEIRELAHRLAERRIRYAYFHVRHITWDGTLRYRYPGNARHLVTLLRRETPQVRPIAWVYAGNVRRAPGLAEVDLRNASVRRAMVDEARWLVDECGFDGVQWDYEICPDEDPQFLALMQETRAALPPEKLLSTATAMWAPRPFRHWGWSDQYFSQVAATCDQLAVMCYDTGMYLPRAYAWLVRQQAIHVTQAVQRRNPRCRVLFGLPTYARGGLSHHPHSENIRMALKAIREGMSDARAAPSVFAGVAPFADYTTQPEEWETYRRLWLRR
jgi:hypothetical protein